MGVVKTINNKQYQQDEKGDWYEVPMPEQNPSIKVIDGRTYQKDRSGNWYDMGESVKKKRNYWSCFKLWCKSWRRDFKRWPEYHAPTEPSPPQDRTPEQSSGE